MSKEIIMADVTVVEAEAPPTDKAGLTEGQQAVAAAENILRSAAAGPPGAVNRGGSADDEFLRIIMGEDAGGGDREGEGGGRSPDRPGGPEGPRGPEGGREPEWLTSPERGRWLVEQIVEMRTTMSYEQRYSRENSPRLKWLYDALQEYVDAVCETRNDPDPFGPHKAYPRPAQRDPGQSFQPPEFPLLPQAMQEMDEKVKQFLEQYKLEGAEESDQPESFPIKTLPTTSIDDRRAKYNNPTSREEFQAAEADIQIYFQQAKNRGLLEEVDAVLNSIHQEIALSAGRGATSSQIQDMVDNRITRVRVFAQVEFQEKSLADPNIPQELSRVGDAYIDWAWRRLERSVNGQPQLYHREGEWLVPTSEQASKNKKETYWELGHYPKMYVIKAETPEQFVIARETFFQMIRSGAIGKSPTAIFEHVKSFIEYFSSEGGRRIGERKITKDFLEENRLELEALLYIFVGSYSKEVYNPKQSKEAMMAMSLDEGPARWVAAYRAGRGGVAVFTHMFDREALMDIYNNPVGERGELDIIAGHFLQDQIQEMVIERGMGIVLKDYDFREDYLGYDNLEAKIHAALDLERIKSELRKIEQDVSMKRRKLKPGETAFDLLSKRDQARLNAFRTNSQRLGLTKSEEEFKRLYESFDKGDYHIKNCLSYTADQSKPEPERRWRSFAEDQAKPPVERQWPESIRKSIDLGRIQVQLKWFRQAIATGQIKLEKGEKAVDRLSLRDKEIYKAAYDEASANFDIAFQMQGVSGEKARRGRGFLYVDRNDHIRYFFEVWDQFRLQKKDINDPAQVAEFKKALSYDKKKSFDIGWMLSKMRDGATTFPEAWQTFYDTQVRPEDKLDFVDNIPVYQAENFANWAVFWTKMKYADAPAKVRRQKVRETRARHIKELQTKGYAAQLWDDFTLLRDGKPIASENIGYDRNGNPVSLSFNTEGVPVGIEFDNSGAVIFDNADQRNRRRIQFDNLDRNTRFPPKVMTFKRPKGEINPATGKWEAAKDARGNVIVEEAIATFQIAAQSDDFRNRYTDHTYWYYQGNNKDTLLAPRVRKAAERIRDGLSRPEDEDMLATQLLIVDPTLRRIRKFDGVQQAREVTLIAAAVLESFQDKQRTRHALHRAFLPKDGYEGRMRTGYRNEDWAGTDRFTMGFEEFAGQQPLRFARRGAAWIANVPFEHDAAGPRWGVHGVGGAIKVMADEIKKYSHQGIVGQFGLTKIFEVFDKAVEMYNHIAGYVDPQTGEWKFGLGEKPTDNNESMHAFTEKAIAGKLLDSPTETIPFLYEYKKCFERLTNVTHDMRVMYSATDNSAGAINLEGVDVFNPDGSFNTAIETDRRIYLINGTARNRQNAFLYGEEDWIGFYKWLQDEGPGGGADVYAREKYWNSYLNETFRVYYGGTKTQGSERIDVWLTDKII